MKRPIRRIRFETLEHRFALSAVEWNFSAGGNGHSYEQIVGTDEVHWAEAKARAESMSLLGVQGHLVTITSAAEQQFVTSIYDGQTTWIGLTDDPAFGGTESSGQPDPQVDGWVWVTGEPVSFVNWFAADEPNNQGGSENFVTMADGVKPDGWNDVSTSSTLTRYLVEFDVPDPWHNQQRPLDVNGDRSIAPSDALSVINHINAFGPGQVPNSDPNPMAFYDVNGDHFVSSIDALLIIDAINAGQSGEGERIGSIKPFDAQLGGNLSAQSLMILDSLSLSQGIAPLKKH